MIRFVAEKTAQGKRVVLALSGLLLLVVGMVLIMRVSAAGVADRIDRPVLSGIPGRALGLLAPPASNIEERGMEEEEQQKEFLWVGPMGSPELNYTDALQELRRAAALVHQTDLARYTLVCVASAIDTPPPCDAPDRLLGELTFCLMPPSQEGSTGTAAAPPAGLYWCSGLSTDRHLLAVFLGRPARVLETWRRGCARAFCRGRLRVSGGE